MNLYGKEAGGYNFEVKFSLDQYKSVNVLLLKYFHGIILIIFIHSCNITVIS